MDYPDTEQTLSELRIARFERETDGWRTMAEVAGTFECPDFARMATPLYKLVDAGLVEERDADGTALFRALNARSRGGNQGDPMNPADYKIHLFREPLMGCWSYVITTPDGRELVPIMGIFMRRENIEAAAMRRIKIDATRETLSGDELAKRVSTHAQTKETR